MTTIDPVADAAAEAAAHSTPERLERITALAKDLYVRQKIVEQQEAALKAAKEEERALRERTLPELMSEAGITSVELNNGWSLSIKPILTASLAGDVLPRAIAWLRKSGHTGLIKREVTVAFGKNSDKQVLALRTLLDRAGFKYDEAENVNTTSFKALVRELADQGKLHTVPVDQVGVYIGRQAVLKSPTPSPSDGE